ncbi:hypothetical protein [uncultured Christiangramia sp.]|uniref:hypothetical protein n=1 Tax=Christiangramia sp. 3-2217-3z TaxID=3417564 RepID=UPI0025F38D3F|nr:hypothetical protein [uncultured Christiangramia sp.]|tara:strand:+ start:1424 stop:1663 length:240 start_codon:yes stop_codon:yes gene_type:complete
MRRLSILAIVLMTSSVLLTSCRQEAEKETIVKEVEVEKQVKSPEEADEREGILERTAKKVDNEVNKEIDEEIEKIGDDN